MTKRAVWLTPVVLMVLCAVLLSTAAVGPAAAAMVPPPQVLLEVHPNERGEGPPGTWLDNGGPFWTWPVPGGSGAYAMEIYRFWGSEYLWIQVCAQTYGAFQNKPNAGSGNQDTLRMTVDGVTPTDIWGIQSGAPGADQWVGDVDQGRRVSLEFLTLTAPGPKGHTMVFTASMCPTIWWIKVYDLVERMLP